MGGGGGQPGVPWDSTTYVRSMWSSRLVMALVLRFAGINRSIDFVPKAKHLSVGNKSIFADIVNEAACSHT